MEKLGRLRDLLCRVAQDGTCNAYPIAAVPGTAQLNTITDSQVVETADGAAKRLKDGISTRRSLKTRSQATSPTSYSWSR